MLSRLNAGSPRILAWLPVLMVLSLVASLTLGVRLTLLPELERIAQADLQRRAAVLAERMRAQLGNQLRELQQLLRSPAMRDAQRRPAAARAELDWLLQRQAAFVWIGLVATDGTVLAGSRGWLEGESVAERPVFSRALQDGRFRSDFHPAARLRTLMAGRADADSEVFDLAIRLDDAQGRPYAVLAAHVGGGWLQALERHALAGLSEDAAPRAHLLIGQPPKPLQGDQAARPGTAVTALSPAWLAWAAAGGTGPPPTDALAVLERVDTQALGSPALSWRVLVLRDRAEALHPGSKLMGEIALFGALAAALLGASGFWAARRLMRPWQALIDAAATAPGAAGVPLGRYADVVHDALAPAAPNAAQPVRPLAGADAALARLAADARYIKRVLDHLPVGVVLSGRGLEIEYVNTTLTRQLGLSAEAVRGRLDGEFLCYPADAQALAAQMHAMAAAPGELAARLVARQADGSPRAVQWHFVPLFDMAGDFDGAIAVVTDIDAETTARRRAAALDQRLRLLLEVAIDHALVLLDDEGRILSWNIGAARVFGASAGQATGRAFESLFDSGDCAIGLPQRLLAQARQDGRVPINRPQRHAGGQRLHVSGSLYAMPAQAWPAAYALIARDVTAQHEADQRLAESEARLAAVVGWASDAILSIDPQGLVALFNPAAELIFGRAAGSVLGRPLGELLLGDAGQPAVGQLVAGQVARRVQALRADGQQLELEASTSQAVLGGRTVLIVILRDVTVRLQAERALARYQQDLAGLAQRLLAQEKETTRRLAQTLHDELGQTLTAMRLTFDACRSAFPTSGPMVERIGRLQDLIIDGNRQVRRALVELRPPLLDDLGLVPALRNELALRGVAHAESELRLELAPALEEQRWPAAVEYAAFMVAREAVLNALQHGRAPIVEVRLEGHAGELRLAVLDDGVGLPPGNNLRPGHLGLVGMRERALAIGAALTVAARPEGGTVVTMAWQGETTNEPAVSG